MARAVLTLLACCALGCDAMVSFSQQAIEVDAPTPIQRVVKLLSEMRATLEKEAAEDSAKYEKMQCWCKTNEKQKTQDIADADAKIDQLMADVESFSALDGELRAKIAALKEDLVEKKESLAKLVAIREKEHAEFQESETEMVQAVTMLKNALAVLAKHNEGLLQMTPSLKESLGATMRWAALKHDEMQEMGQQHGKDTPTQPGAPARSFAAALLAVTSGQGAMADTVLSALRGTHRPPAVEIPVDLASKVLANAAVKGASLVQAPVDHWSQKPTHMQAYAPQSGQVYGILEQLKADFEANLSDSQKAELAAQEEFEEVKAAAEKEIESMTQRLDDREEEFGTNTKALSDAKEDLGVMREQRSADVKFLSDLRLECQDLDHQWEQRSKARQEEIVAVTDAIAIITSDDSRDLFHKKMGGVVDGSAVFLQVDSALNLNARMKARRSAASVLMHVAAKLGQAPDMGEYEVWKPTEEKPHEVLAAMAVKVQIDAFSKVKKAIDDMVADLKAQQDEEVKHKAYCNSGLRGNEKETYQTEQVLADIEDKITALTTTIEKLTTEIAEAKEEIKAMEVQIKAASEARKAENLEFKEEVSDQRAMQNILNKAVARLRLTYKKKDASLLQDEPISPEKFQPYKQHAGASGVIGLIEQIVEDSQAVEKDAIAGEQAAQKAYEGFIADSSASIKALNNAIESKTKTRAAASIEKEEAEVRRDSTKQRLEDLAQATADLHAECDFVLKNFDIRQKARLQEIEALQGAKALLSGMVDDDAE